MLITNSFDGVCQISEDFTVESSLMNGLWQGNIDQFAIENGRLRLIADAAGSSTLLYPFKIQSTWEASIWFKLDFAPSNQNMLRIYLWSKDTDIDGADALYIQIGETGSNDDIELYYRQGGVVTLLGTGEMGQVGTDPVIARIRVKVTDSFLELSTDYKGGTNYQKEIEIPFELSEIGDGYFAISCTYTSSRSDRFYFDDIYIGDFRIDTIAPKLLSIATDLNKINLSFSESISQDISSANFVLSNPEVLPISYSFEDNDSKISLLFENTFEEQKTYQLKLKNIMDINDNSLDTIVSFVIPSTPLVGDILINEILFNPIGTGADYVEIINTTDKILDLKGITLVNIDKEESVSLNAEYMMPNSYLVFTDDKINILQSFPFHNEEAILEQQIPNFNNTDGNVSIAMEDQILDSFDYDEDYHNTFLNNLEGISMERRSVNEPTNDAANWTSALSSTSYGTPGLPNSISAFADNDNVSFSLTSRSFSPDGDGYNDELEINYAINGSLRLAVVKIFSDTGAKVKELINNDLVGRAGQWHWDGRTEDGSIAPIGIYVIWIQLLTEEGLIQTDKLTTVLAKNIR